MELLAAARPASLDSPSLAHVRAALVSAVLADERADSAGQWPDHVVTPLSPRRQDRRWRATFLPVGLAVAASATAVAIVLTTSGGVSEQATPKGSPKPTPATLTASEVLLAAAAHVSAGSPTGRYWRVREVTGELLPAGTAAHPYDVFFANGFDDWYARAGGRRGWNIYRQLATVLASRADAAAWRAAGSPTEWTYPFGKISTRPTPPRATWQISDGAVGLVEGDLPGLTAAQFKAMPDNARQLAKLLRRYALRTCAGQKGCSTLDQIVWTEAVDLLYAPISANVRAATFKVMAALPGVRLLGKLTDPLGRRGYAFGTGPSAPRAIAIIDPSTGRLLATESIGSVPRTLPCPLFYKVPGTGAQTGSPRIRSRCPSHPYVGRSYDGQVNGYDAIVSAGWTGDSPVLPPRSTWTGPDGRRG
jgi:hypothetical protein